MSTTKLLLSVAQDLNINAAESLDKKVFDLGSFNDSINKLREVITNFNEENRGSKKNYENHEVQSTTLKTIDSSVNFGLTSLL